MRKLAMTIVASTGLLATAASPSLALPMQASSTLAAPATQDMISQVQYRRWHGGHRNYGHRYYGHRRGWGGGVGAGIAGLAAGAIIGGAIANSQAQGYYAAPSGGSVEYCSQRFKSYDPSSGTYLGYDGDRHPCP